MPAVRRRRAPRKTNKNRKDPKPRHIDGAARWANLENTDPERKYVYAYIADMDFGKVYYESLGYRVEVYAEDGPRPAFLSPAEAKRRIGDEIEFRGHVLMSIDAEKHEQIQEYGPDGMSGYQLADEIENKISGGRSGLTSLDDDAKKHLNKYFDLGNDTEPPAPVA